MTSPEEYLVFEALLHRADRFPPLPRLEALTALTWWLAWAESTIAHESQIEADLQMLAQLWPAEDEMTRPADDVVP